MSAGFGGTSSRGGDEGRWVPWGSAERSADPERTTTPLEDFLSRALVVGAMASVVAYLVITAIGAIF